MKRPAGEGRGWLAVNRWDTTGIGIVDHVLCVGVDSIESLEGNMAYLASLAAVGVGISVIGVDGGRSGRGEVRCRERTIGID